MMKIKVLFLASNPTNTDQLRLDEEIRAITEKIRASKHRDQLELVSLWAVRPDDLIQTFNEYKPHIVHFSGHGTDPSGEIVLADDNGRPTRVTPQALKSLFNTLKDNIQVVVLNACYSHKQAQGIAEVIDCIIGMNAAISDEAAILFVASFYRAIGFGRSVRDAFEQGKLALLLANIPEGDTPELLAKSGVDPWSVFLLDDVITTGSSKPIRRVVKTVTHPTKQADNRGQILVVDHDREIRRLFELYLNANFPEFSTVLVRDGQTAIDYINQHQPKLTILDEFVPQKDGYDVLEVINERNADLFVILTTPRAISKSTSKSRLLEKYENIKWRHIEFLPKPFNVENLGELIEQMEI